MSPVIPPRKTQTTARRVGLTAALWSAAVFAIACGGEAGSEPEVATSVVRDSAGITIVENASPAPTSRASWTVGAEPTLSIGTLDEPTTHQLFGVRGATVLHDGRIAIANRGSHEIKVFTPDGSHSVTMAREGEGPGEFRNLTLVAGWAGDSIVGWDASQRRVSVFDSQGEHGRTFAVQSVDDFVGPQVVGVMSDLTFLTTASESTRDERTFEGMIRPKRAFAIVDQGGDVKVSLGSHPGNEGYMVSVPGMISIWGHPHAKTVVSAPWGDLALISFTDRYELLGYDAMGDLARIVRMDHSARPPAQADMQLYFDELLADVPPDAARRSMETLERLPVVESFPAFESLLADRAGFLWVRDYDIDGEAPGTWIVFDPEGRVVGRMETPDGLEVYEIGTDYVLGRARDDLDVEYVQMYSLTR